MMELVLCDSLMVAACLCEGQVVRQQQLSAHLGCLLAAAVREDANNSLEGCGGSNNSL